jgi:pimeloyl-ACP methyl ester carboxylesterase
MAPEPFTISIPQAKVDHLKAKLSLAELPDELEASEWDLGAPLADIARLTKAWQDWDWRQAEEKLNKLPHYHTGINVDGFGELDIHFVWQKSEVKNAIPLLFVHGCMYHPLNTQDHCTNSFSGPGSFIEVSSLLPLLSSPDGPAFHVVAPSLPNFGFSEGVKKRGFAHAQYAELLNKLMLQLGYDEYVTQGGDWGTSITRALGLVYPQHCKASHLNMVSGGKPTLAKHPLLAIQHAITPYTARDKAGLKRASWFATEGVGYHVEQSTKPQTLTYALNDSPVALLAWIYEKLHDWSDEYPWTDDEILTWISIYQFSRAGPGAAHRIYYEVQHTQPGPGKLTRARLREYIPNVKYGLSKLLLHLIDL